MYLKGLGKLLVNKSMPLLYKLILLTLLIQTIVISNIIKGLLIPYILIILLVITTILYKKSSFEHRKMILNIFLFLLIYFLLNGISQLINLNSNIVIATDYNLFISNENSFELFFRKSFITQSLYFIVCVIFYLITMKYLFQNFQIEILRYTKIGLYFFVIYGYFIYFGYFVTGTNVDFLSNRITGEENYFGGGEFQRLYISGFLVPRFQSLVGEPSMFAFAIVPFFIYYYYLGNKFIYFNLLLVLLLSTSSTAIIGIVCFLLFDLFLYRKAIKFLIVFIIVSIVVFIININIILDFLNFFYSKINLEHISGITRFDNFNKTLDIFINLDFLNQLFGIGFGYVRSTDGLTTILVNNGMISFLFIMFIYVYPIVAIKTNNNYIKALKVSNFTIYIMIMTSVPEFYNLHIYLFLSLIWYEVLKNKRITNASS